MKKFKQILAIIAIVLLAGLYIATLVLALCGFDGWFRVFMASVGATIMVPIVIWLLIRMIDKRDGRD